MKLHELPSIVANKNKRLGRGRGSGVGGHTVGRGQKGQKTRGKIPAWFEGGQLPLIRRTPFIKGKSRFQSLTARPVLISLTQLNSFSTDAVIDSELAVKTLKLNPKTVASSGLKVVANGKLEKSVKVKLPVSAAAKSAIESQKGEVIA